MSIHYYSVARIFRFTVHDVLAKFIFRIWVAVFISWTYFVGAFFFLRSCLTFFFFEIASHFFFFETASHFFFFEIASPWCKSEFWLVNNQAEDREDTIRITPLSFKFKICICGKSHAQIHLGARWRDCTSPDESSAYRESYMQKTCTRGCAKVPHTAECLALGSCYVVRRYTLL